jgi:tight adherence protein C
MNSAVLVSVMVAIIILSVGLLISNHFLNRSRINVRMKNIAPSLRTELDQSVPEDQSFFFDQEERSGLVEFCDKVLKKFGIDYNKYMEKAGLKFAQAGISSQDAIIYYVFMRKFGWVIGLLLAWLMVDNDSEGTIKALAYLFAVVCVLIGGIGADIYLKNRKEKRQLILQRSFPDALDLVLVCVESGLALDAALSRVCKELSKAHPEITKEFNKTRMELTILNDRQKALQNLALRTDLVSFKALVGALTQSERFGTSLTETLRVLSDDYRHQRLMIAEQKAGRLPALMTIPLMLLMMPAFILIIMGPAIIQATSVWGGMD